MKTNKPILDSTLEDDNRPIEKIEKVNTYFSFFIILIGTLIVYRNVELYYLYNYTEVLFVYMKSSLELGGEIIAGLCSIFCGVLCLGRYPIGLKSLFIFGILLILYSIFLTTYLSNFYLGNIFYSGPFFIGGVIAIGYSRWKKLKWIYKK